MIGSHTARKPIKQHAEPVGHGFRPSLHGFRFANRYPGLPLPLPLRGKPALKWLYYGLCGGMCFAALDCWREGIPIPDAVHVPRQGTPLHRYLYRRQLDSFGRLWSDVIRYTYWTFLPDDGWYGTWRRTYDMFQTIKTQLDAGAPVTLGIIYIRARESLLIWQNHQVLAYRYEQLTPFVTDIYIYDPNTPLDDTVFIHAEWVTIESRQADREERSVWGLRCTQRGVKQKHKEVRGFFPVRYVPRKPPDNLLPVNQAI